MNKDYQILLSDIKNVLRSGRMKAIRQLSKAVIESYWDVGKHIFDSQQQYGWGKNIVEQLSRDLKKEFPGVEGFSTRNLWDMRRLYLTYCEYSNMRHVVAEIAWGHHLVILNKTKTHEERLYYIEAIVKMAWGVMYCSIKSKQKLMSGIFYNPNKTISIKPYPNIWQNKPMIC